MKKAKTYYVSVNYPVDWYLDDPNFIIETKIEKLNSKAVAGSGCGGSKREIHFSDLSRKAADSLVCRARKVKKGITACIYKQEV